MRWPWQRKPAPVAPIAPARPRSDWRRVGTLRPTADVHAPTVVPTGLPVLASTRSLLYRERAESSAAPAGRVTGLALVSPVAQADPVSIVAPPVRPTVAARPVRSTLTRAVAEYVGEARVPAVPHRAPAWLRNAPPQVLTPLDAFAMPETSLPEIAVLDSWTTKPPALDRASPELIEEVSACRCRLANAHRCQRKNSGRNSCRRNSCRRNSCRRNSCRRNKCQRNRCNSKICSHKICRRNSCRCSSQLSGQDQTNHRWSWTHQRRPVRKPRSSCIPR